MIETSAHYAVSKLNINENKRCSHERRLVRRLVKKFGTLPLGLPDQDVSIISANPRREQTPDVLVLSGKDALGRPKYSVCVEIVEYNTWSKDEGVMAMLERTKLHPSVSYGPNTILLVGLNVYIKNPNITFRNISKSIISNQETYLEKLPVYVYHEWNNIINFAQVNPCFKVLGDSLS